MGTFPERIIIDITAFCAPAEPGTRCFVEFQTGSSGLDVRIDVKCARNGSTSFGFNAAEALAMHDPSPERTAFDPARVTWVREGIARHCAEGGIRPETLLAFVAANKPKMDALGETGRGDRPSVPPRAGPPASAAPDPTRHRDIPAGRFRLKRAGHASFRYANLGTRQATVTVVFQPSAGTYRHTSGKEECSLAYDLSEITEWRGRMPDLLSRFCESFLESPNGSADLARAIMDNAPIMDTRAVDITRHRMEGTSDAILEYRLMGHGEWMVRIRELEVAETDWLRVEKDVRSLRMPGTLNRWDRTWGLPEGRLAELILRYAPSETR